MFIILCCNLKIYFTISLPYISNISTRSLYLIYCVSYSPTLTCANKLISDSTVNPPGEVKIKPDIKHFTESGVVFTDGCSVDIDIVVYATGYLIDMPFLDDSIITIEDNSVEMYRKVCSTTTCSPLNYFIESVIIRSKFLSIYRFNSFQYLSIPSLNRNTKPLFHRTFSLTPLFSLSMLETSS